MLTKENKHTYKELPKCPHWGNVSEMIRKTTLEVLNKQLVMHYLLVLNKQLSMFSYDYMLQEMNSVEIEGGRG